MTTPMNHNPDSLVLNDDKGNEIKFQFLDSVEYAGKEYVVLLPPDGDGDTVVILQVQVDLHTEQVSYAGVEDDSTLNKVFQLFQERQAAPESASEDASKGDLQDDSAEFMVLADENGRELEFECLDHIAYEGKEYAVLIPRKGDGNELAILQMEDDPETGKRSYIGVDNEDTLNEVFALFRVRNQELFQP